MKYDLSKKAITRFNSVEESLMYLAECQLATLEDALTMSKYSKSDKERHMDLAKIAVEAVRLHIGDHGSSGLYKRYARVTRAINGKYEHFTWPS